MAHARTDRHFLHQNIVSAVVRSPTILQRQFKCILQLLLSSDYPHTFSSFNDQVLAGLSSKNLADIIGTLHCLIPLGTVYFLEKEESKYQYFSSFLDLLGPHLLSLCEQALKIQQFSNETGTVLRLITKFLYFSIVTKLPNFFFVEQSRLRWLTCFSQLYTLSVPPNIAVCFFFSDCTI